MYPESHTRVNTLEETVARLFPMFGLNIVFGVSPSHQRDIRLRVS
jgi:hypothetical protein